MHLLGSKKMIFWKLFYVEIQHIRCPAEDLLRSSKKYTTAEKLTVADKYRLNGLRVSWFHNLVAEHKLSQLSALHSNNMHPLFSNFRITAFTRTRLSWASGISRYLKKYLYLSMNDCSRLPSTLPSLMEWRLRSVIECWNLLRRRSNWMLKKRFPSVECTVSNVCYLIRSMFPKKWNSPFPFVILYYWE